MVKEYRLAYTGEEINERLSDEYMEGKTVNVLTTLESADEVDEIIAVKDGTLVKTAMSDIKSTSVKDYNQNDENHPEYIKNRPIKEEYNYDEKFNENIKFEKYNNIYSNSNGSGFQLNEGTECTVTLKSKIVKTMDCIVYPAHTNGVISDNFISLKSATTYEEMSGFYITCDGYRLSIQLSEELYKEVCDGDNIDITVSIPKYSYLVKSDGTPLTKPYVVDSESYTYGDDALQAILDGRQIYVKVPNVDGGTNYTNFMPVLQYQLPNENNNYLTLFYLKDGIATNLATALQGMMQGNMEAMSLVFGEITMMLSQSYSECPLKVDPVK